jgi:histidinol phosphatase-like PHP family hydrolase
MKRILFSVMLMSIASVASAQNYYVDAQNSEMLRFSDQRNPVRKEIILPAQVGGFNVYKADLHTHSVYSDGSVSPQFRVREAWYDGLDVLAITEHIEYRPFEKQFASYLNVEGGTQPDLNAAVSQAQKEAAHWDMFIIPGTEITRNGTKVGHFNALFTKDNNTIYDEDPVQAIRNAKNQGALVMHNHPGWRKTSLDYTPAEKAAYDEGLIDGVEVMNDTEFYPGIIDRVRERGLFISANTDIHASSAEHFNSREYMRPITLIFATERTEKGIREALEADRTLAFGFNTICGSESLLLDFFKASISIKKLSGGAYMLTNNTSVPYVIQTEGLNKAHLDPHSTIRLDGQTSFYVLNMFSAKDKHPLVKLSF